MNHNDVTRDLYDYLTGSLDADARQKVEQHLSTCRRCAAERDELELTLNAFRAPADVPSDARPDAYWERFADGVERRRRALRAPSRASVWESLRSYLVFHPAPALAAGAACVVVLVGLFFLGRMTAPVAPVQAPALSADERPTVVPANDRLERYLRRSKILLVGLTNMKHEPGRSIDLSAEREVSRDLIKEARYLREQDIDRRSERLIDDLNKILIELANLEDDHDLPDVEIIRGGIHQENLLFKIRMAELMHDSTAWLDRTF
jgi:hypothetical protein